MCWVLISANTYVLTIWSKYRTLSLPHKSHYAWSSQSRSIIVLRKYFSDFCNYNFSLPCNLYTWNNIICQFHSSSSRNFCYGEEWYLSAACRASGSYSPGRRVPLPWFISGSGTRWPGAMSLCPDYLRVRYQVTSGSVPLPWLSQGQVPGDQGHYTYTLEPAEIIQTVNLKLPNPTYSASPISSHENQNKGFCPCFPLPCFSYEQQFLPSRRKEACLCVLPYLIKTNPRCILT